MGTPRPVKEGSKWRLKIDCGVAQHSIHIQLPDRAVLNNSYLRYIADQLFVDLNELESVLSHWTPEQLRRHLEGQDHEKLRSRVFGIKRTS